MLLTTYIYVTNHIYLSHWLHVFMLLATYIYVIDNIHFCYWPLMFMLLTTFTYVTDHIYLCYWQHIFMLLTTLFMLLATYISFPKGTFHNMSRLTCISWNAVYTIICRFCTHHYLWVLFTPLSIGTVYTFIWRRYNKKYTKQI